MKKLLKYLKGNSVFFAILAPIAMMLEVSVDLLQPTLMSNIIDIGVAKGDLNYVYKIGLYMIVTAILGAIGGILCSVFASIASMTMAQNLREGLFDKINKLSFKEVDNLKTSSLITRLTNDVTQVQQMVNMTLRAAVRAPLMAIGGIVMAFRLSRDLSSIFIVAIPIIIVGITFILKKSMPLFTKVQTKIDDINLVMRENILGVRVIKAFNLEKNQNKRFIERNEELKDISIKSQNMNISLWPFAALIMNLSVVAVLWFGGNMVVGGNLEVGKIMAFINYLIQIMNSIIMVIGLMMNFSRAKASADRIVEVLDVESSIIEIDNPRDIKNYDLEFKNVNFKYNKEGERVLENISFNLKEGETLGIIGPTGSGKSSLVNLISRLYDVSDGEILLGSENIKNIKIEILRKNIGTVLQDNILFSGNIEDNIKFGNRNATFEEIEKSAKDAQAFEFIKNKKYKYKERVEQRGKNLSGGQKQRLSITRTLARNPRILIMDDSSSALDMETQSKLQESIKNRNDGASLIVIAQRISAVMDSDKIIVLDDGKISDIGTHKELLAKNEIYRSIALSQLGEEVLLNV